MFWQTVSMLNVVMLCYVRQLVSMFDYVMSRIS